MVTRPSSDQATGPSGARHVRRAHLYLSSSCWDSLWIVQQPICNEIQRQEPVLYVEQFASIFTILRHPRRWRRLFAWLRGARELSRNLRVVAPLPLFHLGHRFPRLFCLEFTIQRWWILFWARSVSADLRVLWVDNPLYECAIGRLGEGLAIYHIADEFSAFRTSHAPTARGLEEAALRKVHLAFAAAEQLAAAKRRLNPRTYAVWNAIDAEPFTAPVPDGIVEDVVAIPTPWVAFVGVLDTWVNVDLLAASARAHPRVQFLVVGPWRVSNRPVREMENVHLLGVRDRVAVSAILRGCAASLVPFHKTPLTERIVPLKIFEALAAGAMPVCTDFSPELAVLERAGYLRIGRTPEEFIATVGRVVAEAGPDKAAFLTEFGLRQTWTTRWADMRREIDSVVRQRQAGEWAPSSAIQVRDSVASDIQKTNRA